MTPPQPVGSATSLEESRCVDVLHFLTKRTRFVRTFYDGASAPFFETKRRIDAGDPPFVAPYSEDDEPSFLAEWIEVETAIEVLGRTCLSMLSDSLKLYFRTWERELRLDCQKTCRKVFKERGFLHGYRACFQATCNVDWIQAPANINMLEQIILGRNDAQHPEEITTLSVRHGAHSKAARYLFFATEAEQQMLEAAKDGHSFMAPTLLVNRKTLFDAADAVDSLATWLEEHFFDARYPSRRNTEQAERLDL